MARPHGAEVPMVERGELQLTEPLRYGQDSAVHEANFEVGVGSHQLGGALVVARDQILDIKLADPDRV